MGAGLWSRGVKGFVMGDGEVFSEKLSSPVRIFHWLQITDSDGHKEAPWIIERVGPAVDEAKEVARHNPKYVAHILWA